MMTSQTVFLIIAAFVAAAGFGLLRKAGPRSSIVPLVLGLAVLGSTFMAALLWGIPTGRLLMLQLDTEPMLTGLMGVGIGLLIASVFLRFVRVA